MIRGDVSPPRDLVGHDVSQVSKLQDKCFTFLPHKGERVEVWSDALCTTFTHHKARGLGTPEAFLLAVSKHSKLFHLEDVGALVVPASESFDLHLDMAEAITCMSRHETVALHVWEGDDKGWVSFPA